LKTLRHDWTPLAVVTAITLAVIFTQMDAQATDPGNQDQKGGFVQSLQAFKTDIQRLRTLAAN